MTQLFKAQSLPYCRRLRINKEEGEWERTILNEVFETINLESTSCQPEDAFLCYTCEGETDRYELV